MGTSRMHTVLWCFAALVLGGFVSLFTAGPALFADGPFFERLPVLAASVLGFAFIGGVLGLLAPRVWKPVAVCLAVSAIPVALIFGADTMGQLPMILLSTGFILGDAAAGLFGVWMGARLRTRGTH